MKGVPSVTIATWIVCGWATLTASAEVIVGSKAFTESVILGELLCTMTTAEGASVTHRSQLGGTGFVWKALLGGDIDAYIDYTGTIAEAILGNAALTESGAMQASLVAYDVIMSRPLGFENTYALGMRSDRAKSLGIESISDLRQHPKLRFGFGNEFLDRQDGWPNLRDHYGLDPAKVQGMDHMLAYRALQADDVDVIDIYTTDANIERYDILILKDDLRYFPRYDAVVLYRKELQATEPEFIRAIQRLEGSILLGDMQRMNRRVDLERTDESTVAVDFIAEKFADEPSYVQRLETNRSTLIGRLWQRTGEHLYLVTISLVTAIAVSIPLGIIAAESQRWRQPILITVEIIQTIPGLALLILVMSPLGWLGLPVIGPTPAIIALFLYSLLPIVRNTYAGLEDISQSLRESALALGLSRPTRLWRIELPLAARAILAGIKTTSVINIGYATLGGLIAAGGYGQPIMQGLRTSSEIKMLEGAIPAAILALLAKIIFEMIETRVVSEGLQGTSNVTG